MKLADLLAEVASRLPEPRRKAVEALVAEYGAGENLRFLLTLTAGASKRERRLLRRLLHALDELDERG